MEVTWICILLFGLVHTSWQMGPSENKMLIEKARNETEAKLRKALVRADGSVFWSPLRKLHSLEEAGIENMDEIAAFKGTGDRNKAYTDAVKFWDSKMAAVIQPYLDHPERYRGLIVDIFPLPDDPHWNDTPEYKEAEKNIRQRVNTSSNEMQNDFKKFADRTPSSYDDVISLAWRRYQGKQALNESLGTVKSAGQWAKRSAAEGKFEEGYKNLENAIASAKSELKANLEKAEL